MIIKLSILICTIPSRKAMFNRLMDCLNPQLTEEVEVLFDESPHSVGFKRNQLLKEASGDYVVWIDDDDLVSDDYVSLILEAAKQNPDCIGMNGWMTTNGQNKQFWEISHAYPNWDERNGVFYRHTLHISPVKREIALKVGFKDKQHGEDYEYSMGLVSLLRTEVVINEHIYFYLYNTNK